MEIVKDLRPLLRVVSKKDLVFFKLSEILDSDN